jgi:acetyl-CoA carboxylase carboxyltransferase component
VGRSDVLGSYSVAVLLSGGCPHFTKTDPVGIDIIRAELSTVCAGKGVTVAVPKFKVGDRVERIGWLVPEYMRRGIVTGVTLNRQGQDSFNEYEVNFGNQLIMILFETQLRLVTTDPH